MGIDLGILIQSSGADGALILNNKGQLVTSMGITHSTNIAAMIFTILKMLNGLAEDMNLSSPHQLSCKSDNGLFLVQKYDKDNIVCLITNDLSKVGYILMALKTLKI